MTVGSTICKSPSVSAIFKCGVGGLFGSGTLKQPWKVPTSSVMNLRSLTIAWPEVIPLSLIPLAINPELVLVDVLKGISVNIQNGRTKLRYVAGMSFLSGSYMF